MKDEDPDMYNKMNYAIEQLYDYMNGRDYSDNFDMDEYMKKLKSLDKR